MAFSAGLFTLSTGHYSSLLLSDLEGWLLQAYNPHLLINFRHDRCSIIQLFLQDIRLQSPMPVFSLAAGPANSDKFVHVSPLTPKPRPPRSSALTPLSLRKYKRGKLASLNPFFILSQSTVFVTSSIFISSILSFCLFLTRENFQCQVECQTYPRI